MKNNAKGRPRSDKAHGAILGAAHILLGKHPLFSITMDQIAQQAGVSKATLYRWWPNKIDVLVDAFVAHSPPRKTMASGEGPLETLVHGLADLLELFQSEKGHIIADIIGHGRAHPEAVEAFRNKFLEPRRTIARELVEEAQRTGELRSDLDVEVALDMIFGPLYYRLLVQHLPLQKEMKEQIRNVIYKGFC